MKTFAVWYLVELLVDAPSAEEIEKQQPALGQHVREMLDIHVASPTIQIGRVADDGWDEVKVKI